ncbi:hypothetical protein [Alteromonas oceanisediminis]|uniref:hypothetical protein n=1 Tax=Alteromonas oceanisediminis TaxID=2836180 RepID=UPI001BDA3A83|nr:hypothetical protein [Alteromonas oceanisediminis]MBT0587051.1 hypothetical protein [Alteromonas oceanisediminis]
MHKYVISFGLLSLALSANGTEQSIKGIIDVRLSSVVNSGKSYISGGYGKFNHPEGLNFSLEQLGVHYAIDFTSQWSANVVANASTENGLGQIGVSEAYAQYKWVPSVNGIRVTAKMGLYYPKISIENVSIAWSTPYTLTSSGINNWVGEELRNTGFNISVEKLGKFHQSEHNFALSIDIFQNNDTAGAMLAWHGWTVGNQQSLIHQKLPIQQFSARDRELAFQAELSDPFIELDNRWGGHISGDWSYRRRLSVTLGVYDNNAERGIVKNGQYTWDTAFLHSAIKFRISEQWEILAQFMQGQTTMTSPKNLDLVDNKFSNHFLLARRWWDQHQVAIRLEKFKVEDLDEIVGDNNDEQGRALSISYRYKINRNVFLLAEYSVIHSDRWSRTYNELPSKLTEQQYQIGTRYYF